MSWLKTRIRFVIDIAGRTIFLARHVLLEESENAITSTLSDMVENTATDSIDFYADNGERAKRGYTAEVKSLIPII